MGSPTSLPPDWGSGRRGTQIPQLRPATAPPLALNPPHNGRLIMIRTLIAAFCVLTVLNVAASACEGSKCTATTKPMNILQFMRLQAASTRILNPLPKKASGVVGNSKHRNSARLIAARANSVRTALRGSIHAANKRVIHAANKKPVFHSRSLLARRASDGESVVVRSFVAQEPSVQVVTSDEPNAMD